MAVEAAAQTNDTGIVGRFFHTLKEGQIFEQGEVISRPEPGWYLVNVFGLVKGDPHICRLARLEDMATWLFYENSEIMRHAESCQ